MRRWSQNETPHDRSAGTGDQTESPEMGEKAEERSAEKEMTEPKCKYLSDDFSQVCVNGDCPVCADFCPVTNCPEICKFAEMEVQE